MEITKNIYIVYEELGIGKKLSKDEIDMIKKTTDNIQ